MLIKNSVRWLVTRLLCRIYEEFKYPVSLIPNEDHYDK
jgi:hypothetical protein